MSGLPPQRPRPLGPAAFHGPVGEFVRLVEPHTEADPAALLLQFLTGFGNLVGRGPHFTVERTEHGPVLFCALVGESAKARKGSSWSHVERLLVAIDPGWAVRLQGGLSSGEGVIWAVRDPILRRDPIRKGERGRISGYEEVEADPGVSDKRLLVYEPELASVLRVMEREGNTLSAQLREAWDGRPLRVLTKQSPAQATGAHISVVSHITADELRRYLTRTETGNGTANRFLWFFVSRSRVLPDGGAIDEVDFAPLTARLRKAADWARALGPRELRRDDEARELWHAVYEKLSDGKAGLLGAVISRAEAQVMRLALISALLDESPVIRRVHLEAALEVWRYAEESACFIFGEALGDPVADAILASLRTAPEGLTRWEISRLFSGHREAAHIGRALRTLLERGLVSAERIAETSGRPPERWRAVLGAKKEKEAKEPPVDPSPSSLPSPVGDDARSDAGPTE